LAFPRSLQLTKSHLVQALQELLFAHVKVNTARHTYLSARLTGIEFLNIFQNYRPPVYQPSQSPVYSNAGISLVGLVVEAASNRTFEAAINDLILLPLALQHTSTGIVPDNAKNMFIPAGSADWDVELGILGPYVLSL
jgi:CubicO group peptidase (beta-lactamase class C family)